jgi:sortase A
MRASCSTGPILRLIRGARIVLSICAGLLLGYSFWAAADAWFYQLTTGWELDRVLAIPPAPGLPPAHSEAGLVGRIEIPRIGVSAIVAEGTRHSTLRRSVGHIAGTALPGTGGNVGLSGHRDTYFRPLRNIRNGDMITLTTLSGPYQYRVVSTAVVEPANVAVLAPARNEVLTLVTCYPFFLTGPAPKRFIVRAERVDGRLQARMSRITSP